MEKKAVRLIPVLLCLGWMAAYTFDLTHFTDLSTGFSTAGEPWMRYTAVMLCVLAIFLLSRSAAKRPAAFCRPCRTFGIVLGITGGLLAVDGLAELIVSLGGGFSLALVGGLLRILGGGWFLKYGLIAFEGPWARRPDNAWGGVLGTVIFVGIAVQRFELEPASILRMGHIMLVLSSIASMMFLASLLKLFYMPGVRVGDDLRFTGVLCFLAGTCSELPQTLCAVAANGADENTALSIVFGLLGLCGLCAAQCTWSEECPPGNAPAEGEPGKPA